MGPMMLDPLMLDPEDLEDLDEEEEGMMEFLVRARVLGVGRRRHSPHTHIRVVLYLRGSKPTQSNPDCDRVVNTTGGGRGPAQGQAGGGRGHCCQCLCRRRL